MKLLYIRKLDVKKSQYNKALQWGLLIVRIKYLFLKILIILRQYRNFELFYKNLDNNPMKITKPVIIKILLSFYQLLLPVL